MADGVERRAACGASYNACASGATPCKFETRQPARPVGKARADRQFQRRVRRRLRVTRRVVDSFSPAPKSSLEADELIFAEIAKRMKSLDFFNHFNELIHAGDVAICLLMISEVSCV